MKWLYALAWLAGSLPLTAAELVQRDLQISLAVSPSSYATLTRDDGVATCPATLLAGEIGGRYSFAGPGQALGLIGGLDLVGDSDAELDRRSLALRGSVGGGWAFAQEWTVTGELGLRYGYARFTGLLTDGEEGTMAGDLWGWDARVTLRRQLDQRFGVLLWTGWADISENLTCGCGSTVAMERRGFEVGVGVSYMTGWFLNGVW